MLGEISKPLWGWLVDLNHQGSFQGCHVSNLGSSLGSNLGRLASSLGTTLVLTCAPCLACPPLPWCSYKHMTFTNHA